MTRMIDTEGFELPITEGNDESCLFDISIFHEKSKEAYLLLGIPLYFQAQTFEYNSGGFLKVDLRDVLEEYLAEFEGEDGGAGLLPFAKLLREMAERYEKAASTIV